ncbi:MAG TPA: extracellular solute-binding protein [Fimbriimonadaceae bacterium]
MRALFVGLLGALLLLSVVAWYFQPPTTVAGKTILIRVSDNNPLRQAQVDLFNKLNPTLQMELDPSDNGVDKVIVQSMGGVGPDLFDSFSPLQLSAYVQSDIAMDMTHELKKRGIDITKDCFKGMMSTCIYQGRVYGVPTNIAADGIWFHRDLLRAAGIPDHKGPWTWAEFIPIAQKLTKRDANGKPLCYGFYFDWWNFPHFLKGFGAHIYSPDGTKCVLDSPESIAAVQLMHDLVYKYKVSSSPVEEASMSTAGGFGSGSVSVFAEKHAATALGGRWWLAQLRDYKGLETGVMESPYGTVRDFHAYGRCTLVNKEGHNIQDAIKGLLYMAGPEYNNLVNDQADGICAFIKYTKSKQFLFNPKYPKETDNAIWLDIAAHSSGDETSPFISGQVVNDMITEQLDLVKADQKSPLDAMHDVAAEVNQQIQKNLQEDPALMDKYKAATRP